MRFCVVNRLTMLTFVASVGSASAAPLGAGVLASLPAAPPDLVFVADRVPVPTPRPGTPRQSVTAQSVPDVKIVGHVKDGRAVPISATAFAARAWRMSVP